MNLQPLERNQVAELKPVFDAVEAMMGFVPRSLLIMARDPELARAFIGLGSVVNRPNPRLGHGLKPMAAHIASSAAGCRYCQAHTAETAARMGVPLEKLRDLWVYETSPWFTEAERAALAFAQAAGSIPYAVDPSHFDRLRQHFGDPEILDLIALISFFGFLNRWNDSLATQIEDAPARFASEHLAHSGWIPGKHDIDGSTQ